MIVDAVILSGGRGARLGGESKASLELGGVSLLDRTVAACDGVRRIVMVGDAGEWASGQRTLSGAEVSVTRETPPFGGPVAALAAGMAALRDAPPDAVLVLAVDMPHCAALVPVLFGALRERDSADAIMARDAEGVQQPLAAIYRAAALRCALESLAAENPQQASLTDLPMRAVTGRMSVDTVAAPPGSTADVDTPADAAVLGVTLTGRPA